MRLNRPWIAAHIPHAGAMCLLDEVLDWDAGRISCRSGTHRDPRHPLRAHGRLGIACGVEYAAQAMAVHAALLAGAAAFAPAIAPASAPATAVPLAAAAAAPPAMGFLAALRGLRLHVLRLDDVQSDLQVNAVRLAGNDSSALYEFELLAGLHCLLEGRATVVVDGNGRLTT